MVFDNFDCAGPLIFAAPNTHSYITNNILFAYIALSCKLDFVYSLFRYIYYVYIPIYIEIIDFPNSQCERKRGDRAHVLTLTSKAFRQKALM